MRFNYRIVFIITALLFTLSTSLTVINYVESMGATRDQLKHRSLPLTLDNIYTKIQKQIIEPNLIASVMSNDTFVKHWLAHEEVETNKITQYLQTIKNKYDMFTTFLVSKHSNSYYTDNGLLEKVSEKNPNSDWYYDFLNKQADSEINIDNNKFMGDSLIMFINHKIYDDESKVVGVTGIGLKTSYLNQMFKYFRERYHFNVFFINNDGKILISEQHIASQKSGVQPLGHPELDTLIPEIIKNEQTLFEYTENGDSYLLTKKYIEEIDTYLIVEAKVDNFTGSVKEAFYFNVATSLMITLIITLIVLLYVRKIHTKLNDLASNDSLTSLPNRRTFHHQLEHNIALKARNNQHLSVVFFDVDDFKLINDALGHDVGDTILIKMSTTIQSTLRNTDFVARWGGEEFIILLLDTKLTDAKLIAESLRKTIEQNEELVNIAQKTVTISLGVTEVSDNDNADTIFKRVDDALYHAKRTGKNRVVTSSELSEPTNS